MFLIEPCCTQKHWPAVRSKIGKDGTVFFHGYGDLSAEELFPVVLSNYTETDMTIVSPALSNAEARQVLKYLDKTWAKADGKGKLNVIKTLTLITDLRQKKSPVASKWTEENPYPGRLILHNVQQNDTAILLPDLVIYGNINFSHDGHFTALASTNAKVIANLRDTYMKLVKT